MPLLLLETKNKIDRFSYIHLSKQQLRILQQYDEPINFHFFFNSNTFFSSLYQ